MIRFFIVAIFSFLILQCFLIPDGPEEKVLTWTSVFSDNFDRSNSDDISPFTFQVYGGGQADIFEGALRYGGDMFWAIRTVGYEGDTIRVSANCTVVSGQPWFGLSAKSRDLGNNWRNQELYGFWVDADSMGIYEIETESPLLIAAKATPVDVTSPYVITLVVMGKDITGYIEDSVSGIKDSICAEASFQSMGTIVSINGTSAVTDTVLIDNINIETGTML